MTYLIEFRNKMDLLEENLGDDQGLSFSGIELLMVSQFI
jgi:hypothetical protein